MNGYLLVFLVGCVAGLPLMVYSGMAAGVSGSEWVEGLGFTYGLTAIIYWSVVLVAS